MKKIALYCLLFAIFSNVGLVGCQNLAENAESDRLEDTEPILEVQDSTIDENGYLKDDLPNDLDYDGRGVSVYVRGDTLDTEFNGELTGEVTSDALFHRNLTIEERLNIDLICFANTSADYWNDRTMYIDTVRSAVMANDNSIDIVAGLSIVMPDMTREGLFQNLLGDHVPYLDYDKPWWPSTLLEELTIQDRMYFVSGEASLGVIKGMMCFYFNQDILDDQNLENPYDLVENGEWTLSKFYEMASSAYIDKNGNGKEDTEDQFGFIIRNENHATNFVSSTGLKIAKRDENGIPQMQLGTEAIFNLVEKINGYMKQDGFATKTDVNEAYLTTFDEGLALFVTGEFSNMEIYRDLEFQLGILPYPKADESQQKYITTARNTYTGFAIPASADLSVCAAVLEAFASESYRQVTPAYYETALKQKYSRDDVSARMFDLIKDGICYDFGATYANIMDLPTARLRECMSRSDKGSWVTKWASMETKVNTMLTEFIDTVLSLES